MFRKPPSKLEQLQDAVVHALDNLSAAVADLPADRVAHSTQDKFKTVAQTQRHLGEAVSEKTGALRAKAGDATHTAAAVAARGAQSVAHTAQSATGAITGAASTVADAVTGAVGGIGGVASNVVHSVGERLHLIHHEPTKVEIAAQHAHDWSEAAQNAAASVAAIAANRAARAKDIVVRRKVEVPAPIQIHTEETSSRWLWIGVGILAGAALALLLAPSSGRRSRALISDKLGDAKKGAGALGGAAVGKIGDIKRRTEGAIHNRFPGGEDDADDNTIADRVRTTLGEAPATRNLDRLNVDCADGLVTLRGPLADAELQAEIEAVVRAVKGVKEVKLDLLTDESESDAPTFVG